MIIKISKFVISIIVLIFNFMYYYNCALITSDYGTNINLKNNTPHLYEPNWESLDTRPLPLWYDEAKIGIFIHWGVYSVPSFGSEWFWINWRGSNEFRYVDFMNKNYKPGFTYQEFARDFTAEHFNATEWAKIFEASGAKYIVFTSKHHDGYEMWPSQHSFSWNAMDVGPHKDIVGELCEAIRNSTTLKFGLYHSLFEWFNPMYVNDRLHLFQRNEFVINKVIPQLKEIVNRYHPDIVWSDGEWEAPYQYWNATEFLAWLYNESPVRKTVVTNDRWGMETLCTHGDFFTCTDRFNPGVLKLDKWENAFTLDKNSWGHRADAKLEDFMTSSDLIKELVTTVSCGGNINVNVGPTKTGIIEPIFVERLYDMGRWLNVNGEAIYSTIPWKYQNDTITPDIWYTSLPPNDQRQTVYAIVLHYPYENSTVNLYSMAGLYDNYTSVSLLGYTNAITWYGSNESMVVQFPEKTRIDLLNLTFAWTLKIDIPINLNVTSTNIVNTKIWS